MSKEKIRKVFLDDLPRYYKGIDWKNCMGCKVSFIYDDIKGEIEIIKYEDKCLIIKYLNKENRIGVGEFRNCRLGKVLGVITNEFKYEIEASFKDDKRNLVITDREYRKKEQKPDKKGRIYLTDEKWYKYTCNKCGWTEGWIEENSLKRGNGCASCSGRVVTPMNNIWNNARWMCNLGVSEEDAKTHTCGSGDKVMVTCSDCGSKRIISIDKIYKRKSISCKRCSDGLSYPEKFIYSVLSKMNIKFETQYSPSYLDNKRSDFFLSDYNIVIEADGGLGHKGGIVHSKSNKTLEECIKIDEWKDKQHLLHGIETIRINCFESDMEYIKNSILNSKLNELFDLSKIDWEKADLYAVNSNLVKEVSDYWNRKKEWETTKNIAINTGINRGVTINYLKKGNGLGWCSYSAKEEMKKSAFKNGECNKKRVEIFKDGVSLGIFESCAELARQSEERFGIKMIQSSISSVYVGKRKSHKGYIFKYI